MIFLNDAEIEREKEKERENERERERKREMRMREIAWRCPFETELKPSRIRFFQYVSFQD